MSWLIRVLMVVLALKAGSAIAEPPRRIVSINLCTDQLALMLADRDQIQSLTYMATDPLSSVLADQAIGIPANYGKAEEVLVYRPDLVLAGTFSTRYTVALLGKLGYPTVVLSPANDLDSIKANIRAVAAAVGHPQRGEKTIREMEERAHSLAGTGADTNPKAIIYRTGGRVAGSPSLGDSALKLAGFSNLAGEIGLGPWGSLSIEGLLRSQPDLLILDDLRVDAPSHGRMIFNHPALKQQRTGFRTAHLDGRATICGTPHLLDAAEDLARQYQEG